MGQGSVRIERIAELGVWIEPLVVEARDQGFRFMERLCREWLDGTNRFDRPGEIFLAARLAGRIVGVGGLNRDPYADDASLGRVRHLYVLADFRERGIGRALVERIAAAARPQFAMLRLRTDTERGARFYESVGFRRTEGDTATHTMHL